MWWGYCDFNKMMAHPLDTESALILASKWPESRVSLRSVFAFRIDACAFRAFRVSNRGFRWVAFQAAFRAMSRAWHRVPAARGALQSPSWQPPSAFRVSDRGALAFRSRFGNSYTKISCVSQLRFESLRFVFRVSGSLRVRSRRLRPRARGILAPRWLQGT